MQESLGRVSAFHVTDSVVPVHFLKKDNDITFIVLTKNNILCMCYSRRLCFSQVGVSASIWKDGPSTCLGKMEFVACDIASVHDILEKVSISSSIQCDGNGDSTTFSVRNQAGCMGPN